MILLDRYLCKQFARNLLLVLAALLTIYLLIDFFERIDDFVERGKSLSLAAKYFVLKIPLIVGQLTPVIILLGGIIVLGLLNHHGEILALKAVGILRSASPCHYRHSPLIFTLSTLAFAEWIVPQSLQKSIPSFMGRCGRKNPRASSGQNRFDP